MTTLLDKTALVIGGSSGVGRVTVQGLLAEGMRVTAVARDADRLRALVADVGKPVATIAGDATDESFARDLLRRESPDVLVIAMGINPKSVTLDGYNWESFSEAWNSDLKATFHLVQQAISQPLRPGSTVVIVSSGAAINGSPISGGYAGAKRMQWLLAGYAQKLSDSKHLGIRFVTVVPLQLIQGTAIAARASAAYGAQAGISAEEFMNRMPVPLTPEKVAAAIVDALRDGIADGITAITVNGSGVELLK